MKPSIIDILSQIQELERESHRLLDESFTNIAFSNLDKESREKYIQQRYQATKIHSDAMDILLKLQQKINKLIDLEQAMQQVTLEDIQEVALNIVNSKREGDRNY